MDRSLNGPVVGVVAVGELGGTLGGGEGLAVPVADPVDAEDLDRTGRGDDGEQGEPGQPRSHQPRSRAARRSGQADLPRPTATHARHATPGW